MKLTRTQLDYLWMSEHDTFTPSSDRDFSELVLLCYLEAPSRTRGPVPPEAFPALRLWAECKIDEWDPAASRMARNVLAKIEAEE